MVVLSSIAVVLVTVTGSLASPFVLDAQSVNPRISERGPEGFSLTKRGAPSYQQKYVAGGDVIYTPSGSTFNVKWSAPSSSDDFVVGLGWQTGTRSPINFSGNFGAGSGTGMLSVYGWSTNPLVEYYVVEDSLNPPSFGTYKGTVSSDGGSYNIYENTRINEPSIVGTSTFNQYISVRQSKRSSGTVTVANHFNAWASYGMNLGTLSYQVVAIEGWGGEGEATQTVSN